LRSEDHQVLFRNGYYPSFVQLLDPHLGRFFQKHSGSFPAVDIGSGRAVVTIGMALNFRPPVRSQGYLFLVPQ